MTLHMSNCWKSHAAAQITLVYIFQTFMETEFGVEVQDSRSCEGDTRVVRNNYLNYLLYKPQGTNFILQIYPLYTNGYFLLV